MQQSRIYPLADKALAGNLEGRLRAARAEGQSYERIARDLSAEGIPVTGETVRQWCLDLQVAP